MEQIAKPEEEAQKTKEESTYIESLKEQINKLGKKVKDLEEELENAEDDIDGYERDLKRKKEELNEVTERMRSKEKKNSELGDEVFSKTQKLDQAKKVLEIKEQALSFVQEVLQAEKASDGRELEAAVDRLADFMCGEMSDVVKEFLKEDSSAPQVDDKLVEEWALSAKKTWLKNKTTIAFVGEFSAGKTSIVNRILSQDNPNIPLLPVSAKATTAIPTYISGGSQTAYQFYSPDNILKSISELTFKRVTKEVLDQVEGLSSLITYFVMKYRNPNLKNLSILDTPGFNSNDSEDSRRTIEVINECDALFWVFDVNMGTINRSSLSVIKKYLRKPLYIVINKVDTKSDKEVDAVEALIKKTMDNEGINVVQYIRFSSKPKYDLASIMTPIQNVQRETNRDKFLTDGKSQLDILTKEWTEKYKSACDDYNNHRCAYDRVCYNFNSILYELCSLCQRAVDIPQQEFGFLGADKGYKMSTQDYNRLVGLLDEVVYDKCPSATELFKSSKDIVDKMSSSYKQQVDVGQSLLKLKNVKQKYNKLVAAYTALISSDAKSKENVSPKRGNSVSTNKKPAKVKKLKCKNKL